MKIFDINIMRFIGAGGDTSPDYLGVLSHPEYTNTVCQQFSDYLISSTWKGDVISLTDVDNNNIFLKILNETSISHNFKYVQKNHSTIRYLDLPDVWQDYLATKSKRHKKSIHLYCMEINNKIIAIEYCYKWQDKIFNFQGGFDHRFEKLGPGRILYSYIIEHEINEGSKVFDLLKGEYSYKKSFTNNERKTTQMTIYQNNYLGSLYKMRFKYISNIKQFISRSIH